MAQLARLARDGEVLLQGGPACGVQLRPVRRAAVRPGRREPVLRARRPGGGDRRRGGSGRRGGLGRPPAAVAGAARRTSASVLRSAFAQLINEPSGSTGAPRSSWRKLPARRGTGGRGGWASRPESRAPGREAARTRERARARSDLPWPRCAAVPDSPPRSRRPLTPEMVERVAAMLAGDPAAHLDHARAAEGAGAAAEDAAAGSSSSRCRAAAAAAAAAQQLPPQLLPPHLPCRRCRAEVLLLLRLPPWAARGRTSPGSAAPGWRLRIRRSTWKRCSPRCSPTRRSCPSRWRGARRAPGAPAGQPLTSPTPRGTSTPGLMPNHQAGAQGERGPTTVRTRHDL